MDDVFAREEQRRRDQDAEHDAALRRKACESKNRYRCPYCNGWHLTSKPQRDE